MSSPTKGKFRKAVQEQILTNYYLSKYDRFMTRNVTNYSSELPKPSKQKTMAVGNRKNFKQAIQERKQESTAKLSPSQKERKNFRSELQRKTSLQKQSKENHKNFHMLEDSIINELYSPSPSKIESGRYHEIQIKHKTNYIERPAASPKSILLLSHEEEEAIEINEYESAIEEEDSLAVYQENQDYQIISEAIKTTFDRRSPSKKATSRSPSKNNSQSPSKNNSRKQMEHNASQKRSFRFPPKINSAYSSSQNQDSVLFHENIRPNFKHLQQSNEAVGSFQTRMEAKDDDVQSKRSYRSNSQSVRLRNSRNFNSGQRHKSSERNKSGANSERSYEDSLNQIIPAITSQARQSSDLNIEVNNDQNFASDRPTSELRQSTHELSMISRFSMTSDEGGVIREHLERQINENEFGPYQNALSNLKDLIDDYPHAWPIFVVGQRILQDRGQYDRKRKNQEQQISRLQGQVGALKFKQKTLLSEARSEVDRNNYRILRLVRELGKKLE